jgi:hypothetical protein
MKKKIFPLFVVLAVAVVLAACSSQTNTSSASNAQTTTGPQGFDPSKMTLQDKLAIGTLKLEGTKLAVDSKEAATLLPLWSAAETLVSSNTTSKLEMDALYSQIQSSMTPEQVKAIQDMTLTREDIQKLMGDLGIQFGQRQGSQGSNGSNGTNGNGGNFAPRPGGGQGDLPGGPGEPGGPGGGGNFRPDNNGGTGIVRPTPDPNRPRRGLGFMFIRPLITLLKLRAGS